MYDAHFGLKFRPFRTTPDSECYYPATSHEHALARLVQAIEEGEGLLVVTGGAGSGKTLLCHRFLERLQGDFTTAFLTNSHFEGRAGLLQAILFDLSQPYEAMTEQELRLCLTEYLLSHFTHGQKTLLVIDEAHNLSADLLEELRLVCNLEARQGKALQVVLVGQPGLLSTLSEPSLESLHQRLTVRLRLDALGLHEAADYLNHHIRQAGGQPEQVFSEEALEVLAQGTHGIPRRLNQAAHLTLALAAEADAEQADAEMALAALEELGLGVPDLTPAEPAELPAASSEELETVPVLCAEDHPLRTMSSVDGSGLHRLFVPPRHPA